MDCLNGSPSLMIVSDLDSTMVDHDDPMNLSLSKFNALWEAYYRHNSLLVFSTGRSHAHYENLKKKRPLLTPDITILSVGTEIMYGESMVPDDDWVQLLNKNWNRDVVVEETAKYPRLIPQAETNQRPHKVSFYVDKVHAGGIMKSLSEVLEKRGLDVKIIYSSGIALDVLPKRAGKGEALTYILEKFQAIEKPPVNTLVCGDSGNDVELFTVPDVYGVMVSNAQEELLHWHAENAKKNTKIVHASERCASAIVQAIGIFGLGPNLSPRDDLEFKEEANSPAHEVVKFYLFYERLRRAEVTKSGECMEKIRSKFYPSGAFVSSLGDEQSLIEYIDKLEKCYGDKQGTHFQVWLDRVSSAQVGADTWLVKFDKWELFDEERNCCPTTALLCLKYAEVLNDSKSPDGFLWMHVTEKG